jgi:NhaA family Na+:H+ antiporter
MPVFALANSGIPVDLQAVAGLWTEPLAQGIILGLVLGKGIGITTMTWLSLRLGLGQLPAGVEMRHIAGIGLLGGMGFTMSIFITNLGFTAEPATLVTAKSAILFASLVAGVSGFLWLRLQGRTSQKRTGEDTCDTESSEQARDANQQSGTTQAKDGS